MTIKKHIIRLLQKILGFDNYLFYFARLKISMLRYNNYEQGFQTFMASIPANAGTILDIGANIGITTVPIAKRFPQAIIHAFEPVPSNAKAFKRIIRHYNLKNVVLHEIALGETNGELKLVLPVINNVKMQGLSHAYVEGVDNDWNSGEMYTVPMKKLDEMETLTTTNTLAAIKIDVENFEYYVLKGAQQLLTRHKPVIYCELWDNEMRQPVMDYLTSIGYAIKIVENEKLINYNGQPETNFVFVTQ